jgi:hypothetical protein
VREQTILERIIRFVKYLFEKKGYHMANAGLFLFKGEGLEARKTPASSAAFTSL